MAKVETAVDRLLDFLVDTAERQDLAMDFLALPGHNQAQIESAGHVRAEPVERIVVGDMVCQENRVIIAVAERGRRSEETAVIVDRRDDIPRRERNESLVDEIEGVDEGVPVDPVDTDTLRLHPRSARSGHIRLFVTIIIAFGEIRDQVTELVFEGPRFLLVVCPAK